MRVVRLSKSNIVGIIVFFSMVGSWELVCAVVLVKLRPGVDLES